MERYWTSRTDEKNRKPLVPLLLSYALRPGVMEAMPLLLRRASTSRNTVRLKTLLTIRHKAYRV